MAARDRVERPAFHGRVEQLVEPLDVGRQQIVQFANVPSGGRTLAFDPPGQQRLLDDVQPGVPPRFEITRKIVAQQPVVHEGLIPLVVQEWLDDGVEKLWVLFVDEEVQFVTGILRVLGPFLIVLHLVPVENEAEFDQLRIAVQRSVQTIYSAQAVVSLEPGRGHVLEFEAALRLDHTDSLLLREVLLRVQPLDQPQIDEIPLRFSQSQGAIGSIVRIDRDHMKVLPPAEFFARDRNDPPLIRRKIHQHGRTVTEEIEIGEVGTPGSP